MLSASFANGSYNYELLGFSKGPAESAIIHFNEFVQECALVSATVQEVAFAPKDAAIFLWSCSLAVPATAVRAYANSLAIQVNNVHYPIYAWYKETPPDLAIPDVKNIRRVSGQLANAMSYRNEGRTEYLRHRTSIDKFSGSLKGLRLLDWGVGCGRVAQHFFSDDLDEIAGADIDEVNIGWCRSNLEKVNTYLVPTVPPSGLPEHKFDIVISSSVLSHLVPEHWRLWLKEISKTLNAKGMAYLSFHGDHSCAVMAAGRPALTQDLCLEGFVDLSPSLDLGEALSTYYRNVLYTDAFARELFEEVFVIHDLIPGLLSGSQTLAVLSPKS